MPPNGATRQSGAHDAGTLPAYPHVPLALTVAFSAYIALWYLHVSHRVPFLAAMRFELLAAVSLFAAAVLNGLSLRSPLTPIIGALATVIVLQVPFSVDPALSWTIFIDGVAKYMMVAIMIASFVKAPVHLRWFLGAFLLAMLKLGQEGVVGVITGSLLWENQGVMRLHGPTPMYEHPNSFSGMAVGTLAFVVCLLPAARRWQKAVLLILGGCAAAIVLFTGSRTGYVGAFGLLLVMVAKSRRTVAAVVLAALTMIAVAMFTPEQYRERFETIFTQQDAEGHSTDLRKEILRDAWHIFLEYPFGVGVGAFPVVRATEFGRTQDTHNLFLEVATNLGIQGVVVFLLLIVVMLVQLDRIVKRADAQLARLGAPTVDRGAAALEHVDDLRLIRQVALATFVFIFVRLTLGLFGMDLYEIYWWFASGLCVALYQLEIIAGARTDTLLRAEMRSDSAATDQSSVAARSEWNPSLTGRLGSNAVAKGRIDWVEWQRARIAARTKR